MTAALRSLDPTRASRISSASTRTFDIAVIGGGILGAAAARDAALRGYSVLLLEANDYAFGTSSRSSKLLHGGLRYLEQGDILLVREALEERGRMLASAPHLCRAQRALFPIVPGLTRPAWQIRIGLGMYDLLARTGGRHADAFRGHERLPEASIEARILRELGLDFRSLYAYSDGQMEDTRLVIENVLDATDLGAITLNHAPLETLERLRGGDLPRPRRIDPSPVWKLGWRDALGGEAHSTFARYICLACGPWQKQVYNRVLNGHAPAVTHSRGIHLVFNANLGLPPLTLPTGEPGRVYFVLPYFSPFGRGTLVGTTDRASEVVENDPQPRPDEVAELLGFLARDLPNAGLKEEKIFHSFCGLRVLVSNQSALGHSTSRISRRELFLEEDACLSLWGGKYTTSRKIAEKALDRVDRYFGRTRTGLGTAERPLPGGRGFTAALQQSLSHALEAELHKSNMSGGDHLRSRVRAAIFRLGSRAALLESCGPMEMSSDSRYLVPEAVLAVIAEQAATIEDVMERRLLLRCEPGDMVAVRQALATVLNV